MISPSLSIITPWLQITNVKQIITFSQTLLHTHYNYLFHSSPYHWKINLSHTITPSSLISFLYYHHTSHTHIHMDSFCEIWAWLMTSVIYKHIHTYMNACVLHCFRGFMVKVLIITIPFSLMDFLAVYPL